jgi:cell shape-determining protein MreC
MLTHILCLMGNSVICVLIAFSIVEIFGVSNNYTVLSLACITGWLFVDNIVIYSDLLLTKESEFTSKIKFESHESTKKQLISMLSHYNALERENDELRQRLNIELGKAKLRRMRSTSF